MKSQWLKSNAITIQLAVVVLLVILIFAQTSSAAAPQLINYQARLNGPSGNPLDTTVGVVFTVYSHPSANNILWSETHPALSIIDGNFSVLLGSVATLPDSLFKGTECYLGITVGADPEITPRNRLASVPYAFRLESVDGAKAGDLSGALSLIIDESKAIGDALLIKNQAGEVLFSVKLGPLGAAEMSIFDPVDSKDGNMAVIERVQITPQGIVMFDSTGTDTSMSLTATGDISGTGQITVGENTGSSDGSTIFGVNNTAAGDTTTISGGSGNSTSTGTLFGTIGGGKTNTAQTGSTYGTIGGGISNAVGSTYSTVGGGSGNSATGSSSVIGGGLSNTASFQYTVVGGGWDNQASGDLATVGGGWLDTASGDRSFVGGGSSNVASGYAATVGGGASNKATGTTSTVAGGDHNYAGAHYATVGGGISDSAKGFYSTISGGIGNTALGDYSTIGAGYYDTTYGVYSGVASGYSNLAGDALADTGAFVGGGYDNSVSARYAFIGGGKQNSASNNFAVVAGGTDNIASQAASTIGGGSDNTASGIWSTISGGAGNSASDWYATVSGGQSNSAAATGAAIVGGGIDTASGVYSTVVGGYHNITEGSYSYAAGTHARALHDGSYVWADYANDGTEFTSTTENQFNVRSIGGIRIYTDSTLTSGVTMGAGASSWTSVSDKSVKKDFREINSEKLLEKLSEIPISRWKYIAEQSQADHIGPMSQDFYSAFGLGDDDKRISTIDADGVALAAIQALYKENQELKKRLEKLELLLNQR